jgi:sterol 3beta-glucosyltransferase
MGMKITILTYGSRGDIQPFLPLSLGLIARGHSVKLAAPSRFKDLVESDGIQFIPLTGEPEELSRQFNDAGNNVVKMIAGMMDHVAGIALDVLHQSEDACQDADLVIHSFLHAVGAHTIACERNIPDIHVQIFPIYTPTGDYPNVTLPNLNYRSLNRLTHVISAKVAWWGARLGFEQVRRRAGLPRQKLYWPFNDDPLRPRTPVLCAWSPSLLPASSDWPPETYVTGWYFFDTRRNYLPSDHLQAFLESGEPPICISFGSMVHSNVKEIDRLVRDALEETHNRGVILSGWGQVTNPSSEKVLYLESAPHDWLLPRCKMILHHGGAGTTSAGLQAGIPNVVIPFTVDQPFWGRRVHAIGAGPAPIPVKTLTAQKLTHAILESETKAYCERSAEIGRKIRSEDGVEVAVQLIEKHSNDFYS